VITEEAEQEWAGRYSHASTNGDSTDCDISKIRGEENGAGHANWILHR
jgi:hypothetical protein